MRRPHQRNLTLLGEAFALKESKAWEDVADGIHIQDKIAKDRRRLMLRVGLGILALAVR
ncbi:MAG: hypothetical protein QGH42_04085 [Kiritimatiellia bacterium]|nr:hypothetical protein [Candidatus Brocadiia bacterium]MDP6630875.1 hypothetical protein [Kiritimatiellia bacterium]MDP6811143.1 hypothetical protein [Kiritimatiellia bacterium]MDP7023416.1 hypothetical protein [Kiritimatiellia bacterium]